MVHADDRVVAAGAKGRRGGGAIHGIGDQRSGERKKTALALERAGFSVANFPLSAYRHRSFYAMRTDALDRFGTRLERRFTRREIAGMMERAGLERIVFASGIPYWTAVGYRRQ